MPSQISITFVSVSDTIAFYSVLTSYDTIPFDSTLIFNEVLLNEGDGCVMFGTSRTMVPIFIKLANKLFLLVMSKLFSF